MAVHERVWERTIDAKPWQPIATYSLLGAMALVYLAMSALPDGRLWLVWIDWPSRPWSPITSTFAHGGFGHLFLNGLMLFFFGPSLERILGRRVFVAIFLLAGAATGILQVELSAAFGMGWPALGASGAIMMVFGALVILMPTQKILIWGLLPVPFWAAAAFYAIADVIGAFNPNDGIGNFAHLAGMYIGVLLGLGIRHRSRAVRWAVGDGFGR